MNSFDFDTLVAGAEALDCGAEIIRGGGLVAFPTETVYGLGADAFNAEAVESIFLAKGRPQDNPLIVHIPSLDWVGRVAAKVPDAALDLYEAFSPGPLTIVLPKIDRLPLVTTAGLQTVGIRIPNNKIARELIERAGTPIAAPSANRSGRVSPTRAVDVYEDMKGRIPLILDGGMTDVGIESTVVSLVGEVPVVLRPGAVTLEMIASVIGKVVNHRGKVVVAEAPGMKYRHYAPTVPCFGAATPADAAAFAASRTNCIIVGASDFVAAAKAKGAEAVVDIGDTPAKCMRNAFAALREAEKSYDCIVIEHFDGREGYFALNNRLSKSYGGQLVPSVS